MVPKMPPLPMTATTPTHHHSKSKVATNNCILEQTPDIGFRLHMSLSFQFQNKLPMACRAQCCCCPGFPMPCNPSYSRAQALPLLWHADRDCLQLLDSQTASVQRESKA